MEEDARGANTGNSAFQKLDLGSLAGNAQNFAIRLLQPFADVKHPPIGGHNRPIFGEFQPVFSP